MTKIEHLKNDILEPLASSPGLSGTILDVFGAQHGFGFPDILKILGGQMRSFHIRAHSFSKLIFS